jgi:hypothetical protein
MLTLLLAVLRLSAMGADSVRETEIFRPYKFQQPIEIERSIWVRHSDGSEDIRTAFSFTDRSRKGNGVSHDLWYYWGPVGR